MATVRLQANKRTKKDGSSSITLVIRIAQARFIFATGIDTPSEAAFSESGLLNKSVPQYKIKNNKLTRLKNAAEKLLIDEEIKLAALPFEKVKQIIGENVFESTFVSKIKLFIDYLDEFVSFKTNMGTRSVYATTRSKLLEFDPKCTFETMDRKWLTRFEAWMKDSGMKTNAYAIHLRNIRAVFNYAIDEEVTTLYPFRKFKIKKEETRKRSLTADQLAVLRDYPCEEYQKRYRDLFMLMFYLIGINAVDLFNARPTDVAINRLEYKRAKTGKLYSIRIEPEALEIIERYRGREYLLNIMDEYGNHKDFLHRMGIGLKQIGECKRVGLGGKKVITPLFPDISSYWARHTWATIAHQIGVSKDVISMALGHTFGVSTTDIYINYDNNKIDEANRKVIDYLNDVKVD